MTESSSSHRIFGGCGLGTFPFTGAFGTVEDDRIAAILDAYFDRGGVYLDTAPTYAFGATEARLGRYLKSRERGTFAVSTSCGYVRTDDNKFLISGKPDDVRRDLEESLERLNLQQVDVYISHIPDPHTPLRVTMRALNKIKQEGLARLIGVSNVSTLQVKEYLEGGAFDVIQNRFSFLNRTVDRELAEICASNKIKVIAYQVIERGILTSRGPSLSVKEPSDLRSRKPEFSEASIGLVGDLVRRYVGPIAERHSTSIERLAARWAVHKPPVALAQLGAKDVDQVKAMPIDEQELHYGIVEELEEAYRDIERGASAGGFSSIRAVMGLEGYDIAKSGSASGT